MTVDVPSGHSRLVPSTLAEIPIELAKTNFLERPLGRQREVIESTGLITNSRPRAAAPVPHAECRPAANHDHDGRLLTDSRIHIQPGHVG